MHQSEKLQKDYHEVNLLVPWSITLGIVAFVVFVYFIWVIEFDIFRNPDIVTANHLHYGLLIIAIFLSILIIRELNKLIAKYINKRYQARFHHLKSINSYIESKETCFFTEKKYEHIVLLLHGFSASPQEFQFLIPHLKAKNINYYALSLMGFGLDNTTLLSKIKRQDWYRNCLETYDMLSGIAKNVSIVGHSMGGILAAYIAANRPVHQLIFTAPGFYPTQAHNIYKILLTIPIISSLYMMVVPYMPKALNKERGYVSDTLDPKIVKQMFHYLAVPINSVRELLLMQKEAHVNKMHFDNLTIICGRHEQTIDIDKLIKRLKLRKVPYQLHYMEQSAHSVLEDFDREKCCTLITNILSSKFCSNNHN